MSMTHATARFAILRLISIQLDAAGFTHVQDKSLLEDIEGLLDGLIEGLVHLTYEFAQHTRRSRPNIRDMVTACADQGIELCHLQAVLSQTLPHMSVRETYEDLKFELPIASSTIPHDPTVGFLSSESESEDEQASNQSASRANRPSHSRAKLNMELVGGLPHLPALPAKHTWRQTYVEPAPITVIPPPHVSLPKPTVPTSEARPDSSNLTGVYPFEASLNDPNIPTCLHSLNRRILDTRLVERSLRNLVERTSEDSENSLKHSSSQLNLSSIPSDDFRMHCTSYKDRSNGIRSSDPKLTFITKSLISTAPCALIGVEEKLEFREFNLPNNSPERDLSDELRL
ncbi:uncharacterized protein MELLADRAFT_111428 [Melampsora larici-populina 98AG31]|uniref:Transcription factor TFIID subunit 8 C-terminal domain-containing protein n=1 Tax=Melampsora larici-populina (strain 98AG31 / pathotype 3-4-7) TaxID=747676 RepID=F4S362_MELLP|nr:uncharacterized protein MELLADRAFT_111428 [Melampsora larici-populina 98AG31]EGG00926.1 hypothetical protein MELLADRAFT_111428 [Melampsora larici-populina 98AG31]